MSTPRTLPPARPIGTNLAPLVYWLLLVCGLAGITFLHLDDGASFLSSKGLVALWAGSVVGVALGQGLSALRIRAWVPALAFLVGFWLVIPLGALVLDHIFGSAAKTFALAFLPAAVSGYVSLTERGALPSFWYPAVLWMVVILDGPTPGVFEPRFALPFVVGLAALFIVYLRARETRRVALWKAYGTGRLASAASVTMLRSSPLRAAAQHSWSAMIGAAALVLTAWIAPHLWDTTKDSHHGSGRARAPTAYGAQHDGSDGDRPCCPSGAHKRERVEEYFPLRDAKALGEDAELAGECRVCVAESVATGASPVPWSYAGNPGTVSPIDDGTYATWRATYANGYDSPRPSGGDDPATPAARATAPTHLRPATRITSPAPHVAPPATPVTQPPAPAAATPVARVSPTTQPSPPTPSPAHTSHEAGATTIALAAPTPAAAAVRWPAPWVSSLGLCAIAFALILTSRAVRRAITLRHLTRPFWNEPVDQRISNHWQRMLIGLRDAGVEPQTDEQPQAFARRIGIAGMDTCATILDRVRHGVRLERDDLTTMATAADRVFTAARERAGIAGRATAWLRAPMV